MVDPEAVARVPKDIATRLQVLPVTFDDKVAIIATADPHDVARDGDVPMQGRRRNRDRAGDLRRSGRAQSQKRDQG